MAEADPTNTADLRDSYGTATARRYRQLKDEMDDVFDTPGVRDELTRDDPDAGNTSRALLGVLLARQRALGLRPAADPNENRDAWFAGYVENAYWQGIDESQDKLIAAGIPISKEPPRQRSQLTAHRRGLKRMRTRSAGYITDLSDDLNDALVAELRRDMPAGKYWDTLDARLADRVDKVAVHRAGLIGEYEVGKAYNDATLSEFESRGVGTVTVDAEILTAGDHRVCFDCTALEIDNPYTIEAARGLLPSHPNCRCSYMPKKR